MQTSKFEVNIPFGEVFEWEGKKVSYRYDDSTPSLWGHKYEGFALEITNAHGKVIYRKAIPTKFEDKVDQLVGLPFSTAFDKDGNGSGTSSNYID